MLVVLVVLVFLQTWRASIIPLLAVPVSVVGTFAVLLDLGFSINALTLFGLVLAIGIVVDDAIVVVENVERNIEQGLLSREAAHKAMSEVSGPIVAIALVLSAVFVPIAFVGGVTGQFYRQFAADHRDLDDHLGLQLADAVAGAGGDAAAPRGGPEGCAGACDRPPIRVLLRALQPLLQTRAGYAGRSDWITTRTGACWSSTVYADRGRGQGCFAASPRLHPDAGQAVPVRGRAAAGRRLAGPDRAGDPADGRHRDATRPVSARGRISGAVERRDFTNSRIPATCSSPSKPSSERSIAADDIAGMLTMQFSQLPEGIAFALMPPPVLGLGNRPASRCRSRTGRSWATAN